MRSRATRSRATALAAVLGLVACSPAADGALVEDLDALGITLYLPELSQVGLRDLEVTDGTVSAALDGTVGSLRMSAYAASGRPLCRALRAAYLSDSDCDDTDDSLVATFEEMTTVAVVREGTVLVLHGLVTETDPGLVDAALDALRTAPAVSAEQLVEAANQ